LKLRFVAFDSIIDFHTQIYCTCIQTQITLHNQFTQNQFLSHPKTKHTHIHTNTNHTYLYELESITLTNKHANFVLELTIKKWKFQN